MIKAAWYLTLVGYFYFLIPMSVSRRNFLKMSVGSAALVNTPAAWAKAADKVVMPKRKFGRYDDMVSVVGIGGHTLYMAGSQADANEIVDRALAMGINFFDNAWDYHGGDAEEYMGVALKGKREKAFLMSKFCNYHMNESGRYAATVKGAMNMLEDSLRRLKTDYLDLWMMHQVSHNDLEDAFRRDGAIEAVEKAKEQGKIRYGGFTGHWAAQLHVQMLEGPYQWDAMLMPISAVGAMESRDFENRVIPLCVEQNVALLGMKGFGGSRRKELHSLTSAEKVLQYSLSYPQVCTHLIGIDKLDYLNQAVAGSGAKPFTPQQRTAYAAQFNFEPGSDGHQAQLHGGKLYEAGSCCMRRDSENA